MKASNKKRIEALEKRKTASVSASLIVYDPKTSLRPNPRPGIGICILIPDNGRMKRQTSSQD